MSVPSASRAYLNQLTGSLHLLDLPFSSLITYILKTRLPQVFCPSFLHEATHFWSEATDLGAALASLELRAQRHFLFETVEQDQFIRDVSILDATRMLLTPLQEGLALFQEFDAFPGSSLVWADPGLWAGMLFVPLVDSAPEGMSYPEMSDWLSDRIRTTIGGYRISAVAVRRKIETLMQPLSGDPHFYLLGYLAIKQIWCQAAMVTPAFWDRDLFLSFFRCWIFQDWGLIADLLSEELDPVSAVALISVRLQKRIRELASTDLTSEAALYERLLNTKEPDENALLKAMHLTHDAAVSGSTLLRKMINEIYEGLSRGGKHENVYFSDVLTLKHRQEMMRLAIEQVEIEVNDFQRVLVRRGPALEDTYLAGPAPEGAVRGITPGWLAVYFLPQLKKMLTIAVRSEEAMIWFPTELGVPDEEFGVIRMAITKVIATEGYRQDFNQASRAAARSFEDESHTHLGATLRSHVEAVYRRLALSFVSEANEPSVQKMLEEKGLYTLLGRDGDLFTALAVVSLLPGHPTKESVELILAAYDLDGESVLDQLAAAAQRTGAQILLNSEKGTIWCRT